MLKIKVIDEVRGESIATQETYFDDWVLDPPNEFAQRFLNTQTGLIDIGSELLISQEYYEKQAKDILKKYRAAGLRFEILNDE